MLRAATLIAAFAWVGEASELWLKPTAPAAAARAAVKPTIWVLPGALRRATRCFALCRSPSGLRVELPGAARLAVARCWDTKWPFGHREGHCPLPEDLFPPGAHAP